MKLATVLRPFALLRRAGAVGTTLIALSVAGCALPPSDPVALEAYREANDPLEGVNRWIFGLNEATDILVLRPAAEVYRAVLPDPARTAVRNFLRNLTSPILIANQLLQGDLKGASVATQRFVINSTVGVAGLIDVAAREGLPYEWEDFGQTLAVWGVPEGPYLVLPIFGPSNLRDATGFVADTVADPFRIYAQANDHESWVVARSGASGIDTRSTMIEAADDLRRNSLDYYATVRSLYRQRRTQDIRDGAAGNGQAGNADYPDYPDYSAVPK